MVNPSWESFKSPESNRPINQAIEEIPGGERDARTPEGKKPDWGSFKSPETYQGEPDPTADEGTLSYIARNAVTNTSRMLEQRFGMYGNMEKFAKDTLSNLPESGGVVGWAINKLIGPERWEHAVRGDPGKEQMLPTSQDLKEVSQKATKGYTKPKTKGEEKFQEFTEDVGAMFGGRRQPNMTGASAQRRATQFTANKLLVPAAANVAKQLTEYAGFGEDKANLVKAAVWLPLTLATNINAPQYASHLMNEGRRGLANAPHLNVPRFTNSLDAVERTLLTTDPRSQLARQAINTLRQDLASGQTGPESLLTMYDAVNALKRSRGMFELGRRDRNFARNAINRVRDAVRDEVRHVGQYNPQALQSWQDGVGAWSTIHTSNAVRKVVENLADSKYAKLLTGPAAVLFGGGAYAIKSAPLLSMTGATATPALYKGAQTVYRMWQNPQLANYYWRSVNAAMNENSPAFISNYQKLNEGLKSKEKKDLKSTNPRKKNDVKY